MDLTADESPDTGPTAPLDDEAMHALLARPFTELTVDELMALKAAYEARGIRIYNRASPEQVILAFMAGNFCSAFLQALGQRAANNAAGLPKQASDLVRKHLRRKGKPEELHISAEGDATATIVITASTPDEARLALLDLDVTAEDVRGKTLCWDNRTWSAVAVNDVERRES
jgi:hypothetical protein